MEKFPGYLTFYWDAKTGKIWLEVDKFDSEFLYASSLTTGLGSNDVGLDRVQLGRTRIVKFQRLGPKVLLVQLNYSFRAVSDNAYERRATEDSFAKSVIWGFQVEAEEKDRVLIDATPFLLSDTRNIARTLKQRNQGDYRLDAARSAAYLPGSKNFPYNTEIEALLTFTTSAAGSFVEQVAPDPESITLREHHSFIQLPDNNYEPRTYDPRASFNGVRYMDFATPVDQPIVKRVITRHRLKKKDPKADVSESVKPIIYYVDRGIPEPIRSAIVEGAGWWNQAFEAIGYKDAFQVKLLPEDADPLDVRYNTINWIHRSTRGWSYGSSIMDPRTGEIIKGHANICSLRIRHDFLIAEGLAANYEEGREDSSEMLKMSLARIRQLSVHEVGHTLGLGHNYASHVNDRSSVMDYPAPLVKIKEDGSLDLSDAYATGIGEWDKVSVAYGYQDFPEGVDEEKSLKAILEDAFARGLVFISGQVTGPDAANPLAAPWVNDKHPVDELERVMRVRSLTLNAFSEKKIHVGAPMATLEEVLVQLYLYHRYQVESAASVLGGLYYYHTLRGDVQKNPELVPAEEQRRALDVLLATIKPESLAIPEKVLSLIPPRPPTYPQHEDIFLGYTGLTFDPLGAAETAANLTVGLILHPDRAARLVEYRSRDTSLPSLGEVVDKLIGATWKSSLVSSYYAEIQRVVNHVVLFNLMRLASNEKTAPQVRAVAAVKLDELKEWLSQQLGVVRDEDQKAHYLYTVSQIKVFQENPEKVKLTAPLAIPKGPPI